MITIFGALFVLIFAVSVISFIAIVAGFWRARGMANKVFTLAEQELERKLREGPATISAASPKLGACSHCGTRFTAAVAKCLSFGAGLS